MHVHVLHPPIIILLLPSTLLHHQQELWGTMMMLIVLASGDVAAGMWTVRWKAGWWLISGDMAGM